MKKYPILIVSIIVGILFLKLLYNYYDTFKATEEAYAKGYAINLAKGISSDEIQDLLLLNNYVQDESDAKFIAEQLAYKVNHENISPKKRLKSLSDLQKRIWKVSSNVIDSIGSPLFKEKLQRSQNSLGIDSLFLQLQSSDLPSTAALGKGSGTINVIVEAEDSSASFVRRLLQQNNTRCSGVIVRLSEHYLDSLDNNTPSQRTICYLKTDANGKVAFQELDVNSSYSVIPICKGYEYGTSKGTVGGNLAACTTDGILNCSFSQIEHKIQLLDDLTIKQIKEDKSITIRSPQKFKSIFATYIILVLGAWWCLFLWAARKKSPINRDILAILILLTGICLLTMFSINDPLTDILLGIEMAQGIIAGIIVIILILRTDFVKLYQHKLRVDFDIPLECIKWIFKPFRLKIRYLTDTLTNEKTNGLIKTGALFIILLCSPFLLLDLIQITKISPKINSLLDKLPKGSGYLLTALLLTLLLFTPLGVAVGGMRVNLKLGILFQPSEIAKYLIVIFMAAYFSVNANNIVKYSEKGNNTSLWRSKLRMLLSILIGLGILMGLYLILGDMGPALILAFTFIILYSVIKSKIDLEGLNAQNQLQRILTCDLAMLIYGIISFIIFLLIGNIIGNMGMGCIVWFIVWIMVGIAKKQIYESPIFFNLILAAFIFGGTILSQSTVPSLQHVGERLENRKEMCTNTWGTLPIDGSAAEAGQNTQVAEGLWGLASGGFWGQGLGNGSPHFIPAFHTDMILETIGEQLGFIGILLIIVLFALLIHKTIILGYKTYHPFTFYLCLGIAIVTAIQFIIISLGSTGMIPLTGVTVPFFSYGRVSMILNLAAFGIVLAISTHNVTDAQEQPTSISQLQKQNIGKYNYSVSILNWSFGLCALIICSVFFYYQSLSRNSTLIKPVYVNTADGVPIIEYNPRISDIVKAMHAGDIYDRNDVLLATSDVSRLSDQKLSDQFGRLPYIEDYIMTIKKQRMYRYYPFGEHMFFMVGDYNSGLFFNSDNRGYMAEARHLTELRGYDNKKYDDNGQPIKLVLSSESYRPGRYFAANYQFVTPDSIQLRNYKDLIPYLKAGKNSKKLERLNARKNIFGIKPKDIHLTVDAVLQTKLQHQMGLYFQQHYPGPRWNKLRASVVVLDASDGDLLASANYPLPNYDRLKEAPNVYSDNNKSQEWSAYSDMDLGLLYPTPPGSTAKVISSLAGFRKAGVGIAYQTYYTDEKEKIFPGEKAMRHDMKLALRYSSNCYFVNLVNDYDLYDELAFIYGNTGVNIDEANGSARQLVPYTLEYQQPTNEYISLVTAPAERCIEAYRSYKQSGKKEKMNNITGKPVEWSWAWGQNGIRTTPVTMARVISIVANQGEMPITRFVMDSDKKDSDKEIDIVSSAQAAMLEQFLKFTAQEHDKFTKSTLGGKTGTPERVWMDIHGYRHIINDGWYICFIEDAHVTSAKGVKQHPIAIAVRIERINDGMSGKAVSMTKEVVLPILATLGYTH